MKKYPADFTNFPYESIVYKSETETVAQNIMKILKRTGNLFRLLTWAEYKSERLKDGNFSDDERSHFVIAIKHCGSAESAMRFSKSWR